MSKRTMQEKDKARITQLEKQVDCERAMILAMDQDSAQADLKRLNERIRKKNGHLQQLELTMSLKHDLEKARKQISLLANDKTQAIETTVQMWKRIHSAEAALDEATKERDTAQDSLATLSEKLERVRDRRDEAVGDLEVAEAKSGVKYTIRLEKELKATKVERDVLQRKLDTKCEGCQHFNAETKLRDLKRALGIVLA